ncbi:MAG: ATP synthase F0 subunit C [Defluviitaleaceae bacterium]|nr:ATP synthase F0 subunit C [Defluviitaleaceae bacterium]
MPLAIAISVSHIAAAIALLNGFMTTMGQGKVAAAAVEAVARQPEAVGPIRMMMFVGCGFAETAGVYGFVISFILIFMNPLIGRHYEALIEAGLIVSEVASTILPFVG